MELRYCENCGDILELESADDSVPLEGFVCAGCQGGGTDESSSGPSAGSVQRSALADLAQETDGRESSDAPIAPGEVKTDSQVNIFGSSNPLAGGELDLFSNDSIRIRKDQIGEVRAKAPDDASQELRSVSLAEMIEKEGVDLSGNDERKAPVAMPPEEAPPPPSVPTFTNTQASAASAPTRPLPGLADQLPDLEGVVPRTTPKNPPEAGSGPELRAPAGRRPGAARANDVPKPDSTDTDPGSSMDFDTSFFDRMEETQDLGAQLPAARAQKIIFRCPHCQSALSIRPVTSTSRLECPTCDESVYVTMSGQAFGKPPSIVMRNERRQESDEAAYDVPPDESGMYDSSIDSGMYDSTIDSDMHDPDVDFDTAAQMMAGGDAAPKKDEKSTEKSTEKMMSAGLRQSSPLDEEDEGASDNHSAEASPSAAAQSSSGGGTGGLLKERVYDDDPDDVKAAAKAEARPAADASPALKKNAPGSESAISGSAAASPTRDQKIAAFKRQAEKGDASKTLFITGQQAADSVSDVRFESQAIRKGADGSGQHRQQQPRTSQQGPEARVGGALGGKPVPRAGVAGARRPAVQGHGQAGAAVGRSGLSATEDSEYLRGGDSLAQKAAAAKKVRDKERPKESLTTVVAAALVLAIAIGAPFFALANLASKPAVALADDDPAVAAASTEPTNPEDAPTLSTQVGQAMVDGIEEIHARMNGQTNASPAPSTEPSKTVEPKESSGTLTDDGKPSVLVPRNQPTTPPGDE